MTKGFPLNRDDAEEVYDALPEDEQIRLDEAFDGDFLQAVEDNDDRLEQLELHGPTEARRVELPEHIEDSKAATEAARHNDDIDSVLDEFDFGGDGDDQ